MLHQSNFNLKYIFNNVGNNTAGGFTPSTIIDPLKFDSGAGGSMAFMLPLDTDQSKYFSTPIYKIVADFKATSISALYLNLTFGAMTPPPCSPNVAPGARYITGVDIPPGAGLVYDLHYSAIISSFNYFGGAPLLFNIVQSYIIEGYQNTYYATSQRSYQQRQTDYFGLWLTTTQSPPLSIISAPNQVTIKGSISIRRTGGMA